MKNVVICFDGTWNTADAQFPTNVIKTAQLVLPADSDGVAQVQLYDEGVGSMEVAFGNRINRLLSGAFGFGLMENIERAYRFVILNYAPGDRLFLFGFSRGAFSARSFAGLLRTCGVLRKDRIGQIKTAIELYQNRGGEGPDAARYVEFRRENSFAAYSRSTDEPPHLHPLSIEYIGIWDTVGALGIPGNSIFANNFNKQYQFHDLALSSMVRGARHVLAIDEKRRSFRPTPWDNLEDLSKSADLPPGASPPYEQVWFPGDHSSVGGGGTVNGLWQAALVWVVEGAMSRGLSVDESWLKKYRDDIDHRVSVNSTKPFSLYSLMPRQWRDGPVGASLTEVSEVGQRRIRSPAAELYKKRLYRPKPLRTYIEKFGKALGIQL